MASIQTNLAANTALRNLSTSSMGLQKEIGKLSSGFRINNAGDDAAGLAIANKLRAEGLSDSQASRNAAQASSMLQIADGAVSTVSSILDRLKELASQSNSDNVGTQRDKLDAEFQQLISEIGRIASTTKYQGTALVDGTFGTSVDTATGAGHSTALAVAGVNSASISGAAADTYTISADTTAHTLTMTNSAGTITQTIANADGAQTLDFSVFGVKVQTGAGYTQDAGVGDIKVQGGSGKFMVSSSGAYAGNDLITISSINLTTGASGLNLSGLDVLSAANAQTALTRIDAAIDSANSAIGTIGAAESRLQYAASNVDSSQQNVAAAESTIRDADMAAEMTSFSKFQILQQAGTAILAQANQSASSVLKLLQ